MAIVDTWKYNTQGNLKSSCVAHKEYKMAQTLCETVEPFLAKLNSHLQ